MVLNLDSNFNPFPEQTAVAFKSFQFPGGEPHLKISTDLSKPTELTITHRLRSFNDLGLFLIAVDAVKRSGIQKISAFLPYFPGARQDRIMDHGEPLTVKVMAELINSCGLHKLTIYDAHSDVAPALLNNCSNINNHKFVEQVVKHISNSVYLVSPDAGASKKIHQLAKHLGFSEILECSKVRDVKTGQLSEFKVPMNDLKGRDCLIVDDICDGGGTFIGLAKKLKDHNGGKLFLAVSHGIFSKGIEELSEIFDHIYTTDAFQTHTTSKKLGVTQLKNTITF